MRRFYPHCIASKARFTEVCGRWYGAHFLPGVIPRIRTVNPGHVQVTSEAFSPSGYRIVLRGIGESADDFAVRLATIRGREYERTVYTRQLANPTDHDVEVYDLSQTRYVSTC